MKEIVEIIFYVSGSAFFVLRILKTLVRAYNKHQFWKMMGGG